MQRVERVTLGMSICLVFAGHSARADEGGVSFWPPGQFASLSAVPGAAGWSLPVTYYHGSAQASLSKSFIRGGVLTTGIDTAADLLYLFPTYTFEKRAFGGQAAFGLGWAAGYARTTGTLAVIGPQGNTVTQKRTDTVAGGTDLFGLGTLKWNNGNTSYLTYTMFGAPVGAYQLGRLANLGINHWSVDAGGGYTYLNMKNRHEFSIVGGLTYNFENAGTNYKNGIDSHVDWGASQFLNDQVHIGLTGYFFYQLTGDSGPGARLGGFKSRIAGIGPQVGYYFPVARDKGYVNLKGYWEFEAKNRAEGWNLWLSLSIPLSMGMSK
jgi:hypothetical protein